MQPFTYTRVADVDAAIATLAADPAATLVAGATELANWLKDDLVAAPSRLVDINALPLSTIEAGPGGIRLGALARMSDVAAHPAVRAGYPLLSEALELGASAQIRNMASLAGNLMQKTRCPYFRVSSFACNKREPGSGCAAQTGPHRTLAILGTSDACFATHPSDLAVALVALEAVVQVLGPAGARAIPIDRFFLLPGDTPHLEHPLAHDELITRIDVPAGPYAARSRYLKLRDRESYEFALVSVAAGLDLADDGTVRSVRLALGGVGTVPWRARDAEATLVGKQLDAATLAAAGRAAVAGARPHRDNGFKVGLAERAVARAIAMTAGLDDGGAGTGPTSRQHGGPA